METNITEFRNASLITVRGRVDSSTAPALDEAFQSIQDRGRYRVAVDLAGVEYMSSAGLRALLNAQRNAMRHNHGEVVLVRVPEKVRRLLDLAGSLALFHILDDPAALPAFLTSGLDGDPTTDPPETDSPQQQKGK